MMALFVASGRLTVDSPDVGGDGLQPVTKYASMTSPKSENLFFRTSMDASEMFEQKMDGWVENDCVGWQVVNGVSWTNDR